MKQRRRSKLGEEEEEEQDNEDFGGAKEAQRNDRGEEEDGGEEEGEGEGGGRKEDTRRITIRTCNYVYVCPFLCECVIRNKSMRLVNKEKERERGRKSNETFAKDK